MSQIWDNDDFKEPSSDEPVIVFCASNVLAPVLLAKYAQLLVTHCCPKEIVDSVLQKEADMRKWQRIHGCKLPEVMLPQPISE